MDRALLQKLLEGQTLVGVDAKGVQITLVLDTNGVLVATPAADILQVNWGAQKPGLSREHMQALLAGKTLKAWYAGEEMTLRLDADGNQVQFIGGVQIDDQHIYNDDRAELGRHVWYVVG
jgi:hypothetical protein